MNHTLAEAAAAPSDFAEYLIARLATGLDSADREPFRLAAENALATLPPQSLGDGAYRTVEPIWRLFYPTVMRRDCMGRRREETGQQAHRRRQAALSPCERGAHGVQQTEGDWLTYREAAERLNSTAEAVRYRAIRGRWPRMRGNDGRARIQLPDPCGAG